MSFGGLLILIVAILIAVSLPNWGFNANWGYTPTALLGMLFVLVLILDLLSVT